MREWWDKTPVKEMVREKQWELVNGKLKIVERYMAFFK
jgi:hypothetical protein